MMTENFYHMEAKTLQLEAFMEQMRRSTARVFSVIFLIRAIVGRSLARAYLFLIAKGDWEELAARNIKGI